MNDTSGRHTKTARIAVPNLSVRTHKALNIDVAASRPLFNSLAQNLVDKGYSVHKNALPIGLSQSLLNQIEEMPPSNFCKAGIGRNNYFGVNPHIRSDEISWIDGATKPESALIFWMNSLQASLNLRLYLGLVSFESHFALYRKGNFYRRHRDAFSGEGNRVLSVVIYLNKNWSAVDSGELVLFPSGENTAITVAPEFGTMAVFLSEDFPHEVLPTNCDRYSITGWFSRNSLA